MPKIAEIERTPNPDAMRFVLKEPISQGITRSYDSPDQVKEDDEFAKTLFAIPHVISVYYVDKYVTVTQDGEADWPELLRELAPPIREAEPLHNIVEDEEVHATREVKESSDPRMVMINQMLDEQVRPYLLADGGGLQILGMEDDVLRVHYQGACGTCPTAMSGTLFAIESMVKRIDPNIQVVNI